MPFHFTHLGSSGNPHIDTPHLDALAKSGVSFARYYAAPVFSPTRAGLMTGRYAFRTGLYNTRCGGDSAGELMRLNRMWLRRVD